MTVGILSKTVINSQKSNFFPKMLLFYVKSPVRRYYADSQLQCFKIFLKKFC